MDRTRTSTKDLKGMQNVASPHEIVEGKVAVVPYDDVDVIAPAGSMVSTAMDMSRWMIALRGDGRIDGEQILNPGIVREMLTLQHAVPISRRLEETYGMQFGGAGLGWIVSEYRDQKYAQQVGGLSGMVSIVVLVPEHKLGITVLTNFAPNQLTSAVVFHVLDLFLEGEKQDWNQYYLDLRETQASEREVEEKRLQDAKIKGTRPSLKYEAYTGTYENLVSGVVEIQIVDDKLRFASDSRFRGDMEHWHLDTFRVHWNRLMFGDGDRSFLTFRFDTNGDVSGFTLEFAGGIEFTRAKH
jgi:CubicO group peptidase (beta-lactamase class C family)